jgi:hypothetical protein
VRIQPKLLLPKLLVILHAAGAAWLIGGPVALADRQNDHAPSAPAFFITPDTGTRIDTPARNTQFLCIAALPIPPADITLTTTQTPWVQGHKVLPSKIPFVSGAVNWKDVPNAHPEFKTWVHEGQRHFKGNGIPNHPTGTFPVQADTAAYPYYAAAPAAGYSSAAAIPIGPYDLDVSVPADPVYSDTPTCISDLMIGVVTQTGAVWHANLAYAGVWLDPIAALPVDQCWGHPYNTIYHYHGYSWKCFPHQGEAHEHSPLFGYAMDGFGVYGPRGDGGKLLTNADLDECHGHFGHIEWDGQWRNMYHYHLNHEYPYGPGCYRGTPGIVVSRIKHSHGFPEARTLPPMDVAPPTDSDGNTLR